MSRAWRTPLVFLLTVSFLALPGCGKGNGPSGPVLGHEVVVTGEVVEVHDGTPADGGVTITVVSQHGGPERLLFPSLFRPTPPSQQELDLYDLLRRVEVGDEIRAKGRRTPDGIAIESLAILAGHV